MAETAPTAEGDLGRTPFAHLLVYALDRRLTGAVILTAPDGVKHTIQLDHGAPVKLRPGDRYALLGEMLVEAGVIDRDTLDAALATKGLLGSMLVLAGRAEHDAVERVAEQQLVRRVVHLFDLPPETTYAYFDGKDELRDWGADPADVDPLALIWAGLSAHGERSALMEPTLARFGSAPLCLHASATIARFGLGGPEAKLHELLAAGPMTMSALLESGAAPPEVVRRFAYALLITRQIDTGSGPAPLGASDSARSPQAVARMALRSTVHRVGAAAPDLPGDGERGPAVRSPSRRPRDLRADSDEVPPTTRSSAAPAAIPADPPAAPPEPAPPPDPFAGKSAADLVALARERLAARDPKGAAAATEAARRAAPDDPDVIALDVWARFSARSADVKVLSVELDELLTVHELHVDARFYRAMLRKRLSDGAGCAADLRRVVELSPDHADAKRELAALAPKSEKDKPSLFGRLFKRG